MLIFLSSWSRFTAFHLNLCESCHDAPIPMLLFNRFPLVEVCVLFYVLLVVHLFASGGEGRHYTGFLSFLCIIRFRPCAPGRHFIVYEETIISLLALNLSAYHSLISAVSSENR
eukprot:RCo046549